MSINIVKAASLNTLQIFEIKALIDISNKKDNTNYIFDGSDDFKKMDDINNFFLYDDKKLLSFIGIFSPKKTEAELTAITEPDHRKKGYFSKLLVEVVSELKRRKTFSMLFVCDYKSRDGSNSVQKIGSLYEYSEYLLTFRDDGNNLITNNSKIKVIESKPDDKNRLISISKNVFHNTELEAAEIVEENFKNTCRKLFCIIYEEHIIGMIGVFSETERQYIYGFGIEDKYRGMGIGRQTLVSIITICRQKDSIKDICLEVQSDNENALALYRNVGFELVTEFKYYRKDI